MNRTPVDRDELVTDIERILGQRQYGSIDALDQHFAVVDVDAEGKRRAERRGKRDVVVRVVERRDVLDQRLLEVQIVGVVNPLQPRRQAQQVESDDVALPLVRAVVLGVEAGELREIGVSLIEREGFLSAWNGDGCGDEKQSQPEATHDGASFRNLGRWAQTLARRGRRYISVVSESRSLRRTRDG